MIMKTERGFLIDGIRVPYATAFELFDYINRQDKKDYIIETCPELEQEEVSNIIDHWTDIELDDEDTHARHFEMAYKMAMA